MKDWADASWEELYERVVELEDELKLRKSTRIYNCLREVTKLAPQSLDMVCELYRAGGRIVSRDQLMEIVQRDSAKDYLSPNIISVLAAKIRKELGHITIGTDWGRGYQLTPEGRKLIDKLVEDYENGALADDFLGPIAVCNYRLGPDAT